MQEVFEKIKQKLEEREIQAFAKVDGGAAHKTYRNAIEIVDEVAKDYNNGWIPCSERLPEEEGRYICYVCGIRSDIAIYSFAKNLSRVDEYDFEGKNKSGFYNYDSEYGYYEMSNVVAWQPLPKPYKEGGTK